MLNKAFKYSAWSFVEMTMFSCIYIYIYTSIYFFFYIYTHIYIYIYMYMYVYYIHTRYIYIYILIYIYKYSLLAIPYWLKWLLVSFETFRPLSPCATIQLVKRGSTIFFCQPTCASGLEIDLSILAWRAGSLRTGLGGADLSNNTFMCFTCCCMQNMNGYRREASRYVSFISVLLRW